jgi:DNA-binding GntR family transcriptional regulator
MMRTDAYRQFKRCLFSGVLKSGQFVSQRELASLLGVPLNPIREAIRQLECEKLIKVYPQKGIQIIEADPKTINDAHDYRLMLECAAITEFTRNAPLELIEALKRDTVSSLDAFPDASDDSSMIDATVETAWNFHDEIIDFQGNQIISHHYRLNSARIRLFRSSTYSNQFFDQVGPSLTHHLLILDACAERDVDKAVQLMTEDVETSRALTLGLKSA